ncbi:hypothetical protein K8I61_04675 [bacterium]|nr:hypothetical protein [bacterium]
MDRTEIAIIVLLILAAFDSARGMTFAVPAGVAIGALAGLLFVQGLLRDIARLLILPAAGERHRVLCLCAESSVALTLLVVALGLALIGVTQSIEISGGAAVFAGGATLLFGFVSKNYVLSIRKEKDHGSVIVW